MAETELKAADKLSIEARERNDWTIQAGATIARGVHNTYRTAQAALRHSVPEAVPPKKERE